MKVVGFAGFSGLGQDHAGRAPDPRAQAARPARLGGQACAPQVRHRPSGQGHLPAPRSRRLRGGGRVRQAAGADPRVRAADAARRAPPDRRTRTTASTGCWSKASSTATCSRSRSGASRGRRSPRPARYAEDDFIVAIATDTPEQPARAHRAAGLRPERRRWHRPWLLHNASRFEYTRLGDRHRMKLPQRRGP